MRYPNPKLHILYLSGLGDKYDPLRRFLLRFWNRHDSTIELVPSKWTNDETFEMKYARVIEAKQQVLARGDKVVLIGESAGASMALNVYAADPDEVQRVIMLCGKIVHEHAVAEQTYQRNPAFRMSMQQADENAMRLTLPQRQKITSLYAWIDGTVSRKDSLIPDCRRQLIWSVGHILTILYLLSIGSWIVLREVRRN